MVLANVTVWNNFISARVEAAIYKLEPSKPIPEFYKNVKVAKEVLKDSAEKELDDISGVGQTEAAQKLCKNLPANMRKHHLQKGVGHYGIFNGRKFRESVVPIIVDFVKKAEK